MAGILQAKFSNSFSCMGIYVHWFEININLFKGLIDNNMILKEGENTIVDNNDVCEILNDYFANIASSIGFEDAINSV